MPYDYVMIWGFFCCTQYEIMFVIYVVYNLIRLGGPVLFFPLLIFHTFQVLGCIVPPQV